MVLTPFPIMAVCKALQPWKALLANVVTVLGMLMEVSLMHPLNAPEPTQVHPSLMVAEVILTQFSKTFDPMLTRFWLNSTLVNDEQSLKAELSILLMVLGQLISLRLVQDWNAAKPMVSI